MSNRQSSTFYVEERAKYVALFAKLRTHHLHPHERKGDDSEFNLYPWTAESHEAWHVLFGNLTTREVWPLLDTMWQFMWGDDARRIGALPCIIGHAVADWQKEWVRAFGNGTLKTARYTMRCMMLSMAFGHRAFTTEMQNGGKLRALVAAIPPDSDRAWAFVTCFGKDFDTNSYGALRRQIGCILKHSKLTRPPRKPKAPTARP